jgi:hypothetical protein
MNKIEDIDNAVRVPARLCPVCFGQLDGASSIENDKIAPKPGDVSFCIYCAAMLQFGPDMVLVIEDRPEVLNDEKLKSMQEDIKKFLRDVKKNGPPLRCYACKGGFPEELKKKANLQPGMRLVCAFCAAVNLYNNKRWLVEETDEEFLNSESAKAAIALVRDVIDQRKANAH